MGENRGQWISFPGGRIEYHPPEAGENAALTICCMHGGTARVTDIYVNDLYRKLGLIEDRQIEDMPDDEADRVMAENWKRLESEGIRPLTDEDLERFGLGP